MAIKDYEKDLIEEFINWAKNNSPDAWWIYENTDEAIKQFFNQREK